MSGVEAFLSSALFDFLLPPADSPKLTIFALDSPPLLLFLYRSEVRTSLLRANRRNKSTCWIQREAALQVAVIQIQPRVMEIEYRLAQVIQQLHCLKGRSR
jgi:hypothetical protein